MERNKFSRRDFLKWASIVTPAALAACVQDTSFRLPTDTSVPNSPTQPEPTQTLAPTETSTSTPENRTADDLLKLGSFDTTKPFKIVAEEKLRRLQNYTADLTWTYAIRYPLPVKTAYLYDADPNGNFEKSVDNHINGFYGFVYPVDVDSSDTTESVLAYSHDLMENLGEASLGNFSFDLGGFAYNNKDKVPELYEQTVKIFYNGEIVVDDADKKTTKVIYDDQPIEARIVYVTTIPATFWRDIKEGNPRDSENKFNILEINRSALGIPAPSGPDMVQLIVASCQSKIIGLASNLHAENIVNDSFVVLEFKKPRK